MFNIFLSKEEEKIFKVFFRFLKVKNIYSVFLRNTKAYVTEKNSKYTYTMYDKTIRTVEDMLLTVYRNNPTRLISTFPWDKTKEGYKYWSDLCNKWGNGYSYLIRKKKCRKLND